MKAKLVSPVSSPTEWEIELERFPLIIGRSADAEIQPADPSVSEMHCELEEIHGRLIVHDLGSYYGTFVNGVQVDFAPLLPGDRLTVGESSFIASYDPPHGIKPPTSMISKDGDSPVLDGGSGGKVTLLDLVKLLDQQRELFRAQYDQEPWQSESMFPDPPHPEHIEHLLVQEMCSVGVEPRFIYAFEKTGILVTKFNLGSLPEHLLAKWQAAIEEYDHREDNG